MVMKCKASDDGLWCTVCDDGGVFCCAGVVVDHIDGIVWFSFNDEDLIKGMMEVMTQLIGGDGCGGGGEMMCGDKCF